MKYVILKVGDKEVPVIIGDDLDFDMLTLPGKIVSAGVAKVQTMFITCQGTQTIDGKEYGSRGMADEIILRMSDHID